MNRPAFSDYDQNGDGMIGKEEFSEAHARRVGDRARQGYALRNQDKAPSFEDLDQNGDGEISPEEFAEHQQRRR
ncbi:EF-hand domain-containing protein [Chromatocurvus halotolerans]|nr:EF-hand domain-containing protein [Chromatocurvus halotolerans]